MRRVYFGWYHVREWGVHRSVEVIGPCWQINIGRIGITVRVRG